MVKLRVFIADALKSGKKSSSNDFGNFTKYMSLWSYFLQL
jgi:hypothetical protein